MRAPDLEAQLRDALDDQRWPEVDRLGALLDAEDQADQRRREGVTLASAALWYAQQGLRVFPLQPGTKIPYQRSHGFKDATTDPDRIRAWWDTEPQSNIGIATGHLVDVIDIDGPAGVISWARAMYADDDTYLGPPVIGVASTPRAGGSHLYIRSDPDKGNRAGILPGVDYRSTGGYVVAPPSHTDVGSYTWRTPIDLSATAHKEGAA